MPCVKWVIIGSMLVMLAWALWGSWLEARRITMPLAMLLGGILVGALGLVLQALGLAENTVDVSILTAVLDGPQAEQAVELILAVVLFVDSFEIRRGALGDQPRGAARLLLNALPLGLLAALGLGLWLFPGAPLAWVLILACIVLPTDLAPTVTLLKDARLPVRVRELLNVESGYNDGLVAPVFVFALALLGTGGSHGKTPGEALLSAIPESVVAVVVGLLVGGLSALAMKAALARGLTAPSLLRFAVLAVALLTYATASLAHGNGFVAAFVAGVVFRGIRGHMAHAEIDLAEDVARLSSAVLWFGHGACSLVVLLVTMSWSVLLFSAAALTLARILPVLLSLLGSDYSWEERWQLALLGPRGIASVVFAMLAVNALTQEHEILVVLGVTVTTVLGSFLLHGLGAPLLAARAGARHGIQRGARDAGVEAVHRDAPAV